MDIDLRKRRKRQLVAEVLERAPALPPEDGALLAAVYGRALPVARVAALGTGRMNVIGVRRRVRRLVRRLLSPQFVFVLENRDDWPPAMCRVATACVLHGHTMRRAARELGVSFDAVRRQRDALEAMYRAARAREAADAPATTPPRPRDTATP